MQVKDYIFNQEEHHGKKTFREEVDEFIKKYGWSISRAKARDMISSSQVAKATCNNRSMNKVRMPK